MAKQKPKLINCPVKPKPPGGPRPGQKIGPSVEGGAEMTLFERAMDLIKDGADLAAANVIGSNGNNVDTTETQQSNGLSFTAGSSKIKTLKFTNPSDIVVSGAETGSVFTWTVDATGHTLEGHLGGPGGVVAIIISLSGPFQVGPGGTLTPTITATLTDAFPHDDIQGANNIEITGIHVTATDKNNKKATGDVTVDVIDDLPEALEEPQAVQATVVEDALSTGAPGDLGDLSDGNLDAGQDNSSDEASGGAGSLAALFNPGADQPLTFSLASDTSGLPELFSKGEAVTYTVVVNDNGTPDDPADDISTLTATAGVRTVFTLVVNGDGSWSFDLDDQLDHTDGSGDTGLELKTSGSAVTAIDFSSIIVARDDDGDTVTGAASNGFAIAIENDVPELADDEIASIKVYEDALGQSALDPSNEALFGDLSTGILDNDANGSDDVATTADAATFSDAQLQALVLPGADEPITFALKDFGDDDDQPVQNIGGTQVTSGGSGVFYLSVSSTVIVGYADDDGDGDFNPGPDRVIFTLTDNGDGTFTFDLDDQIDHSGADDDLETLALNLTDAFTAEDFDHDPISLGGNTIRVLVENDIPSLTVAAATGESLIPLVLNVDETDDAAGTDRYNPVGPEAADDMNPDGDSPGLGQSTTNINGGLAALFNVGGAPGADEPATDSGTLSFLFPGGGDGPLATNLSATDGGAISLVLASSTLIEGHDTDDDVVFTIEIVDVGGGVFQLQLTQNEAIHHGDDDTPDLFDEVANLLLSDEGAVQLQYEVTRTDSDNDSVTKADQIDLITDEGSFFSFDDDGPTLTVSQADVSHEGLALNVDETDEAAGTDRYSPTDVVDDQNPDGNAAGASLGQVTTNIGDGGLVSLFTTGGDAGSDGEASLTGTLSFLFPGGGSGPLATTLSATDGGAISLELASSTLIEGKDTDGDTVFTIEIVDVGGGVLQLQLTQNEAVVHSDTSLFDEVAQLLLSGQGAVQLQYEVTRTDNDGDSITVADQINLIDNEGSFFSFDDDGPQANSSEAIVYVDEDGLPAGITGGNGDQVVPDTDLDNNESTNTGTLAGLFNGGSDGIDSIDLSLNTGAVSATGEGGVGTIPLTTNDGDPVLYFWDEATGTLYGSTDVTDATTAENTKVFTVVLQQTGAFAIQLWQQVDHPLQDDPNTDPAVEISYEDNLAISLTYQVTDGDGDSDSGTFGFVIDDDEPVAFTPDAVSLDDEAGATATGDLDVDANIDDNVGADQVGTITFANIANGDDSGLTSGGDAIELFLVDNDNDPTNDGTNPPTLEGRVGGPAGTLIFTVTLNHDASGNDTYTVTMFDTVDNGSGVEFNDLTGVGSAGNPSFKIVESSTSDPLELLFTPINETTVNSDSDDVAAGSQFIDIGDPDKGLRVDFGDFTFVDNGGGTDDGFTINSHTTVNGFRFSIDQISNGTTADVLLRAVNANEGAANQNPLSGTDAPGGQHNFADDTTVPITEVSIFDDNGVLVGTAVGTSTVGGFDVTFSGGTVTIEDLPSDYSILTKTASGYDRIEISNAGTTDVGSDDGKFSISHLQLETVNTGDPVPVSFDLALTDSDGDTVVVPGALDITLEPVAPPLVAGAFEGTVEEEHLNPILSATYPITAVGNEDETSSPDEDLDVSPTFTNTTHETTGTITASGGVGTLNFHFASGLDNTQAQFTNAPFPMTSGGLAVRYLQVDADTIIGYADDGGDSTYVDGVDTVVFSLDVNAATGGYTFSLYDKIDHHTIVAADDDEGIRSLDLNGVVQVTDSDSVPTTTNATGSIKIVDDIPVAENNTRTVEEGALQTVDLVMIVDVSGSMDDDAGFDVPSQFPDDSKLSAARFAMFELIENNLQIQNVKFVQFSSGSSSEVWLSRDDALTYLDDDGNWDADGATNYDAGLEEAISEYGTSTRPLGVSDETLVYFLSDGKPTLSNANPGFNNDGSETNPELGDGIGEEALPNGTEVSRAEWEAFLTSNGISASFAVGIGSDVGAADVGNLEPIAYPNDDTNPNDGDEDTVIIVDSDNLAALTETLDDLLGSASSIEGNVLEDDPSSSSGADAFGADGGYIKSITIDGTTYTFDGVGTVTTSGDPVPAGLENNGTWIEVPTDAGGTLSFYFATTGLNAAGFWAYLAPATVNANTPESFAYVLVDGDGDETTANLDITVLNAPEPPTVSAVSATETQINFTIADPDSTSFDLAPVAFDTAFGLPPLGLGPNSITPTEQGSALSGTLQVTDGTSAANVIGLYLGTSGNDTGVTAPLASSPNAMYGFGGNDNLTGGTAGDFMFGGDGNDTLTGGGGADTMSGGANNDTFNIATGDFVAGESIDGGTDTSGDTITLTTTGDGQSVDFTVGTITNVENLTAVDGGPGTSYDQTFTITATQWDGLSSIDMNDGTDVLNVQVSGAMNIAAGGVTGVSDVETGNLTGTGGDDSITLTGAQLNAILIAGSINLGAGTADTINLTTTSTDLNGLSNSALQGVEVISASTAVSAVKINVSAQTEAFTIIGGSGADTLGGGTAGDTLTGNGGIDQFLLRTNAGGDTITDYTDGTDKISFLDTGATGSGSVNFANTTGTAAGAALNASDFESRTSITNIQNGDDETVIVISAAQTTAQITGDTVGGVGSPNNNYVIVFNSTTGFGEIWYDTNWEDTGSRVQIATLSNITSLAGVTAITASDIVVHSGVTDPIVLDLGNPGIALSSIDDGVSFDMNADGIADQMAWTMGEDGILAFDLDGSGSIENGSEIFAPGFAGGSFSSSLDALRSFDSNEDAIIDSADANFDGILVWQDLNHDGVSDAGELSSLSGLGITSINLTAMDGSGEINGQSVVSEGTFIYADGTSGDFVEVALDTAFGSLPDDPLA